MSGITLTANLILVETPTSGRAIVAADDIPANTPVFSAYAPYAHVIYRAFRKEVCATCFSYARDAGKMVWAMRSAVGNHGGVKSKMQGSGGAYFCSESCKDEWKLGIGPLLDEINMAIDKISQRIKKHKARSPARKLQTEDKKETSESYRVLFLQDLVDHVTFTRSPGASIAQETLDRGWSLAEALVNSKCSTSRFDHIVAELNLDLDDMELEVARMVASAMSRRFLEDNFKADGPETAPPPSEPVPNDSDGISSYLFPQTKSCSSWSSLLSLQCNELPCIRERPYDLGVHLRVYVFLAYVFRSEHMPSFPYKPSDRKTKHSGLAIYIQTSESVRAVLARDSGNSFGIWELGQDSIGESGGRIDARNGGGGNANASAPMDSKEMLGWGIWPEASYFNHNCAPNLAKRRISREFVFSTTRAVRRGEELCIGYVDCGENQTSQGGEVEAREKRRELLNTWWFFECACARCGVL